ncbi:methionyl-tRNA formyltransferase [Acetonema longum DSM 6540]|uniref:Methionyl-tRNA formyltransferase n=2 Tax=Acetonema TaxID=2373 RepID=F7NLE4_9FIRM|nr:methionyl-tRNA formyltransferase [Acetonema longum DSM 6540]
MRTIFMGTPDFAVPCLERLISEGHEVVCVVTQPDRPKGRGRVLAAPPVKETAAAHQIPVLQPERIRNDQFITQLAALRPEVIVVVAFGQLLPKSLLDLPPLGCINVHASLLPRYRGAAPIHWAVINGEPVTGVTTMYMDAGMDTGDIILSDTTTITADQTTGELYEVLKLQGAELLAKTMQAIRSGTAPRKPQDHDLATYAPLLTREVERVNWKQSAAVVHNLIRGLNPWPGAYCLYQGKIFKLCRTRISGSEDTGKEPGTIIALSDYGVIVQTGRGTVELLELQPECRKKMNARDCAGGYCLSVGEVFD